MPRNSETFRRLSIIFRYRRAINYTANFSHFPPIPADIIDNEGKYHGSVPGKRVGGGKRETENWYRGRYISGRHLRIKNPGRISISHKDFSELVDRRVAYLETRGPRRLEESIALLPSSDGRLHRERARIYRARGRRSPRRFRERD